MSLLLGIDLGTSAIKASLLDADSGREVASATWPESEAPISSPKPGWAEQDPAHWWRDTCEAVRRVVAGQEVGRIRGIGISYQMHGLVLVDEDLHVLRPSILWCDSRAVRMGERLAHKLGEAACFERLQNLPGNFTAAKLAWVVEHEPELLERARWMMLPGDYLAARMTGRAGTTASGLSEGMLWDYTTRSPAIFLLVACGAGGELLPELLPTFGAHGDLTEAAAVELGLVPGTPVTYRAGDQPNNAFSLGALDPGEVAATAGTSGVTYTVADVPGFDPLGMTNRFLHVNDRADAARHGILCCINGAGSLCSFLRRELHGGAPYAELDAAADAVAAGSEGVAILPFGNGAERTLGNVTPGASVHGLDFNRHGRGHVWRAACEAVAFAMLRGMRHGPRPQRIRAGHANLFRSRAFAETFATLAGARVDLYSTDGAQGAARGAGVGASVFASPREAMHGLEARGVFEPRSELVGRLQEALARWETILERELQQS